MPAPLVVTSPANPRLRSLLALRRRRHRDEAGQTLVEGHEELALAFDAGVRPLAVYFCPELHPPGDAASTGGHDVLDRAAAAGAELVQLSRSAFEKVAYRESPDGWLAVVPAVATNLAALRLGGRGSGAGGNSAAPLLLVCEAVEKPGNLGAVLRTADAAGVAAVLAADPVTDWGNPNLVRASKGTVFAVPVASADGPVLLDWLRSRHIAVVAATPHTDVAYTDVDLTGPTAIVVGTEKEGLSAAWLRSADHRVTIPMAGRANSLNVATSAAILTYEAVRQRRAAGRR